MDCRSNKAPKWIGKMNEHFFVRLLTFFFIVFENRYSLCQAPSILLDSSPVCFIIFGFVSSALITFPVPWVPFAISRSNWKEITSKLGFSLLKMLSAPKKCWRSRETLLNWFQFYGQYRAIKCAITISYLLFVAFTRSSHFKMCSNGMKTRRAKKFQRKLIRKHRTALKFPSIPFGNSEIWIKDLQMLKKTTRPNSDIICCRVNTEIE